MTNGRETDVISLFWIHGPTFWQTKRQP